MIRTGWYRSLNVNFRDDLSIDICHGPIRSPVRVSMCGSSLRGEGGNVEIFNPSTQGWKTHFFSDSPSPEILDADDDGAISFSAPESEAFSELTSSLVASATSGAFTSGPLDHK